MVKNNTFKTSILFLGIILLGVVVHLFNSDRELFVKGQNDLAAAPCISTTAGC